MALKADIRGMVWEYPDTFVVGREQIKQYAGAIKAVDPASYDEDAAAELGHDQLVAPLTYISIFALIIQGHFFTHNDVGLETMQIVQVDRKTFSDAVLKNSPLESMGFTKSDYDKIVAIK